ncbi:MAG: hypothetical protein JW739_05795 [Opitutales bacterium]|nr:hypothetical protein [Opitutales bacterium]
MSYEEAAISFDAWDDAVERLSDKISLPSDFHTEEWSQVPVAIRERAFFSAGVTSARVLQAIRTPLETALQGVDRNYLREDGTPITYSRADAVADIRKSFGTVGDSGDLTDLMSYKRQKLIEDFHIEQTNAYGRYIRDISDPDMLDQFPAQELIRVEPRRNHREWYQRWSRAGRDVSWKGASRSKMIALKTSPIWVELSRFETPYPPFDFGSGMGLRDVGHREAVELGLIDNAWNPKEASKNAVKDFNKDIQASLRGMDSSTTGWLKKFLGSHLSDFKVQGGSVWINGDPETRKGAQPQHGLDRLSPSEQLMIYNYTKKRFAGGLNHLLRKGGKLNSRKSRELSRLRSALDALPNHKGTVYRMVNSWPGLADYQVGKTIKEVAFTSVSVEPQLTYGNVMFVIKARSAKDISERSKRPDEKELIFKNGTEFKITDRRSLGGTETIFLEEL